MPIDYTDLENSNTHFMLDGVKVWHTGIVDELQVLTRTGTLEMMCLWSDRYTLSDYLLTPFVSSGGWVYTSRGKAHPYGGNRYVESVGIKGANGKGATPAPDSTGLMAFRYAILTVKYSTPELSVTQKWTTCWAQETLVLYRDGSFMILDDGSTDGRPIPSGQQFGTIIPCVRYQFRSAVMNDSAMEAKMIAAAQAPRSSGTFRTWAAGLCLYNGGSAEPEPNTANLFRYTIEIIGRAKDWNQCPDINGEWRDIVHVGDHTKKLYESSNLNNLFT